METSSNLTDRAGYIRCCVDGALGYAGFVIGLRYLGAQARDLQARWMEAGTFGYPRERSF
ncbi:hypothetical protein JQ581_31755 [Bradyrhizobium liaoningense]|uniref:hypothetical protein n=1 Tax=Bradyrhizobium liaoningense TaxID=43992 RepID=UPI001BAC0949|nr:hypothetical protein [Bradyrhizobium liaoningense]